MIRTSRRLPWESPHNALARLQADLRARGAPVLDLTGSNPTRAGLPYPEAAIAAALGDPRAARYDPSPRGLPSARQAIAARYAERGLSVDPEHLVLTASTSEAYALLFKLLCDPGDVVLAPRPSYPLFDHLAALEGVTLQPYPLGFDGGFFLDVAALQQELDGAGGRARAVLVVAPNNPTGNYLDRGEVDALVALAAARELPVVCDEVFADYPLAARGPGARRVPSLVEERGAVCLTLDGLSKSLGLPQLKLGWIHVAGPPAERDRLLGRLELLADTYLSVGTPVQVALPALLALRPAIAGAIGDRCRASYAALQQMVAGTACSLLPAAGGWSACLRLPATRGDDEWALALLAEAGVLVQPGYFYDFPAPLCVAVVSLLTDEVTLREGVARLLRLVAR